MTFNRSKLWVITYLLSAVLLLTVNIFVIGTHDIFRENIAEFEVSYIEMIVLFRSWISIFILIGLLPGFVLSVEAGKRYASFLMMLGILTWFQASFLMWEYGDLDGRGMEWQQFDPMGWLDLGIWFFSIAVALRFTRNMLPYTSMIAWILIVGQTVMMFGQGGIVIENVPLSDQDPDHSLLALKKVSTQQNIFHIVLDSMQTDVFWELVEQHRWQDELSGFTLFYENAAVTPHTSLALPAIFSGELFDASQSPADYYKHAMTNGFQNSLYQAGYTVNLIPQLSMRDSNYTNYYEITSTYTGTINDLKKQNAALLLDMSIFRNSPHFLRKAIYDKGNWFLLPFVRGEMGVASFQEKEFLKDYVENLKLGDDTPAYHFIHMMPPHPPYVTRKDGSYAGGVLPNTRENYLNEAYAISKLIVQLVEKLKSLGVYNQAMIVLQGDHGSQIKPVIDGKEVSPCVPRLLALLAVKLPGRDGPFRISQAATSLLDIASTILDALDGVNPTIFSSEQMLSRKRHYIIYNSKSAAAKVVNYSIEGSVFDPKSCKQESESAVTYQSRDYELGQEVRFGMTGNGDAFMGSGWSVCQASHCWSNNATAELVLPVADTHSDLVLQVQFRPFTDVKKAPTQRVDVYINGTFLTQWLAKGKNIRKAKVRIPKAMLKNGELRITFSFPDAVAPNSIGIGGDIRQLAIALKKLRVNIAEDESPDTVTTRSH